MNVVSQFVKGMLTVLTVTATPQLYRYPYRTSAEGLRGDMSRVGEDVESVLGQLAEAAHPRRGKRRGGRHG